MADQWQFTGPGHLHNHLHRSDKMRSDNTLHVIGVISNPVRHQSRIRLFREWYKAMSETPNVKVYVVELAYGDRNFEITESENPQHLQLRTQTMGESWHKENLINLGVKHLLPHNWRYLCWSDCDVFWADKSWAIEAIHELQTYHVIQPWQSCLDLGPNGEGMSNFQSFCSLHQKGIKKQRHSSEPYQYAHTGFAWCCTRKFWEHVAGCTRGHGAMPEWCLVGSADHHMAWAMVNEIQHSVHGEMTDGFKELAREWEKAAFEITQGSLGYVKTRIEHKFHGSKARRYYRERWQIFTSHQYDPKKDIYYEDTGLIHIKGKPALEEEIRKYNRSRLEDSNDL
jgi:virulence-associated protein VapD